MKKIGGCVNWYLGRLQKQRRLLILSFQRYLELETILENARKIHYKTVKRSKKKTQKEGVR